MAARSAGARPRTVIVGAGFGGISAARALRRAPVDVVLVDQHNYHLFQPLLYQVASALLDPADIAQPVRAIVRRWRNVEFRLARVTGVDLDARLVRTSAGDLGYDHLVIAAGAVNNFFGNRSAAERAFGMKSIEEALALRNHVLSVFERAAATEDDAERRRLMTVVIVGGGATGVELAGAFQELFSRVLRRDFHHLDVRGMARVLLLEGSESILGAFDPRLRRAAARTLRRRHVGLELRRQVREVTARAVVLDDGTRIACGTVVWTAGVRAAPLGAALVAEPRPQGRVAVGPALQLEGHPEVFTVGDMAELDAGGAALPMLAPVAIQQGRHAARAIRDRLAGRQPRPFRYRDKGTMATVGRNAAIAQVGPLRLRGFIGWLAWLLVHLMQIVTLHGRIATLVNWAYNYVSYDRPIRLITTARQHDEAAPAGGGPEGGELADGEPEDGEPEGGEPGGGEPPRRG